MITNFTENKKLIRKQLIQITYNDNIYRKYKHHSRLIKLEKTLKFKKSWLLVIHTHINVR